MVGTIALAVQNIRKLAFDTFGNGMAFCFQTLTALSQDWQNRMG